MRTLSIVLGLAASTSALAICPTATPVGLGIDVASGDTTGQGDDYTGSCALSAAEDVSVEFTAPSDGFYEFSLANSLYDTALFAIDTADCITEIDCNDDDGSALTSVLTLSLTGGETVMLVIDGFLSSTGVYSLDITQQFPVCGDGIVGPGEECDDGNLVDGDGCESTCLFPRICGDGFLSPDEECDDGNLVDGDGCESDCTVTPVCGNADLEASEECDDGNLVDGDGCESDCTVTPSVCLLDVDLGSSIGLGVATGNTCGAGADVFATCASNADTEDVTHLWTAPADGTYRFDTNGSAYDTSMTLRDAACDELVCDDDAGIGFDSQLDATVTGGTQYNIVVDGFGSTACGDYVLNITRPLILTSDDPVAGQSMTFAVANATPSGTVFFLVSNRSDPANPICAPGTGGTVCTTLQRPTVLGQVTADAQGDAALTVVAPANLPPAVYSVAYDADGPTVSNENVGFP